MTCWADPLAWNSPLTYLGNPKLRFRSKMPHVSPFLWTHRFLGFARAVASATNGSSGQ